MALYKCYVDVITLIHANGMLQPMAVVWQNHTYKVRQILTVRETFSQAGGCGVCYACRFGNGAMRNLFWEKDRWFVESMQPSYEE
jgi:NADH:ubiquinone oxidoreductase subunit F (NADH-binding)